MPPKEHPPRPLVRVVPIWTVVSSVLAASACVLDLPELPDTLGNSGNSGLTFPSPGGAGNGSGGQAGFPEPTAGQGSGGQGIAGASGGPNQCNGAEKLCTDTCRPRTAEFGCGAADCVACPQLPGATVGCSAQGQCVVLACDEGFADCDADAIPGADLRVSNGCEHSFGVLADPTPPLTAPQQTVLVDGQIDDWSGVPAYAFAEVCSEPGCADPEFASISALATRPLRSDLDGYFRVAWDPSFLYLVVEASDDDIYEDPGTRADLKCEEPADCEESMTLFFDGYKEAESTGGYGASGRRLFMGIGTTVNSKFSSAVVNDGGGQRNLVGVASERIGEACYRIEAQVSWEYLIAQGNPPASQFPPEVGKVYGFDLSLSDWDTDALSNPPRVERQSQVFWVSPGPEYRGTMRGFEDLILGPSVAAGQ